MNMDKTELMKMEGVNESESRGGWNECDEQRHLRASL